MKDVSVIILNYNSSAYTLKCVDSVIKRTALGIDYDIIVVDNNSINDDFEKMKQLKIIPNLKLFRNAQNLGFSGGNMSGIKYTDSKYILFLNNDCEFINDNISILYNFMSVNKNAGLCAGQMYDSELKLMKSINYLPTLSLKLLGNSTLRLFKPEEYPNYKIEYKEPLKVQCLAGAAMFVEKSIFDGIGGFDTDYFLYCEEEDLAKVMKDKGYDVYLVPEAKYIHHLSKSTTLNYKAEREFYISLMHYFRKHNNYLKYSILKLFYFIKLLRKFYKDKKFVNLAFFVLKGAPESLSLRFL